MRASVVSRCVRDRRFIVLAILAVLILLNMFGVLDRAIGWAMTGVQEHNGAYLKSASERASKGFIVFSGLKLTLSVVEGSTVGVGFGLQVGDLVQSVLDHIDVAWKTLLASTVILFAMRILLNIAHALARHALTVGFGFLAVFFVVRTWLAGWTRVSVFMRSVAGISIVVAATLYAVLPFSVWGASLLSEKFTIPGEEQAITETIRLQKDVDKLMGNEDGLLDRMKHLRKNVEKLIEKIKPAAVVGRLARLIAGYLFDCVVFPIGLFVFLAWVTRVLVARLLGTGETHVAEEMQRFFRTYYKDWRPFRGDAAGASAD